MQLHKVTIPVLPTLTTKEISHRLRLFAGKRGACVYVLRPFDALALVVFTKRTRSWSTTDDREMNEVALVEERPQDLRGWQAHAYTV